MELRLTGYVSNLEQKTLRGVKEIKHYRLRIFRDKDK